MHVEYGQSIQGEEICSQSFVCLLFFEYLEVSMRFSNVFGYVILLVLAHLWGKINIMVWVRHYTTRYFPYHDFQPNEALLEGALELTAGKHIGRIDGS